MLNFSFKRFMGIKQKRTKARALSGATHFTEVITVKQALNSLFFHPILPYQQSTSCLMCSSFVMPTWFGVLFSAEQQWSAVNIWCGLNVPTVLGRISLFGCQCVNMVNWSAVQITSANRKHFMQVFWDLYMTHTHFYWVQIAFVKQTFLF